MKKLFKQLFVFLIILGSFSYPLSFYLSERYNTYSKQSWILNIENNDYDYAVLGSSRVENIININTIDSICKTEGINLGTSGGNYSENYLLLNQFLKKNKINNLILNVDEFSFNSENSFSHPFHTYNFLPLLETSEYNEVFKDNLNIYKYYTYKLFPISKYIEFNDRYFLKQYSNVKYDITKGSDLEMHQKSNLDTTKSIRRQNIINKKDVKYFNKILNLCDVMDVNIIFITTPIYSKSFKEKPLIEYIKKVSKVRGIEFHHFSKFFDYYNPSFFSNVTHTSFKGSIEYSKILAHNLKNTLKNK